MSPIKRHKASTRKHAHVMASQVVRLVRKLAARMLHHLAMGRKVIMRMVCI